jgi:hypothetical protein
MIEPRRSTDGPRARRLAAGALLPLSLLMGAVEAVAQPRVPPVQTPRIEPIRITPPPEVEILEVRHRGLVQPARVSGAVQAALPGAQNAVTRPYLLELVVRNNGPGEVRIHPAYVMEGAPQPQPGVLGGFRTVANEDPGTLIRERATRTIELYVDLPNLPPALRTRAIQSGVVRTTLFLARPDARGSTLEEWLHADRNPANHVVAATIVLVPRTIGDVVRVTATTTSRPCEQVWINATLSTAGWRQIRAELIHGRRSDSTHHLQRQTLDCQVRTEGGRTNVTCPVRFTSGAIFNSGLDFVGRVRSADRTTTVRFIGIDEATGGETGWGGLHRVTTFRNAAYCGSGNPTPAPPPPPPPPPTGTWHTFECVALRATDVLRVSLRGCMDPEQSEYTRFGYARNLCVVAKHHIAGGAESCELNFAVPVLDTGEGPCSPLGAMVEISSEVVPEGN